MKKLLVKYWKVTIFFLTILLIILYLYDIYDYLNYLCYKLFFEYPFLVQKSKYVLIGIPFFLALVILLLVEFISSVINI